MKKTYRIPETKYILLVEEYENRTEIGIMNIYKKIESIGFLEENEHFNKKKIFRIMEKTEETIIQLYILGFIDGEQYENIIEKLANEKVKVINKMGL
jgi:hypothetical protein